jgi:MoxR-like ATPase
MILNLARQEEADTNEKFAEVVSQEHIFAARRAIMDVHMAQPVEEYIVQLVMASRFAGRYSEELASWIEYGGSPRATIALDRCSRALAWLRGRDFVSPGEVQEIVHDVLRHRLILSFEAEANGISRDFVIDSILKYVPVS